jgi:F-type H+-transporting ATPase subunit b
VVSKYFYGLAAGIAVLAFCGTAGIAQEAGQGTEHHEAATAHAGGHKAHLGTEGTIDDPAEFKGDLAIYTFVVFGLLLALLYKFAWGPVTEGLERREASIHDNIANAEVARIKAEKMLAEHAARLDKVQDEVREILAEAKRGAEHTKTEIIAAAQQEAEAARQRAVQDIDRARDQALDDLFGHMAKVVGEATEQVLGRTMTGADNERLIDEALSGFAQRKH